MIRHVSASVAKENVGRTRAAGEDVIAAGGVIRHVSAGIAVEMVICKGAQCRESVIAADGMIEQI